MTTEPLRVLVLDQGRGVWGAQRYLLRLAPSLRQLGVELTLAGPKSLELSSVWSDSGFDAIDLDLPLDRTIRSSGRPQLTAIGREGASIPRVARMISGAARLGHFDAIWANSHWTHLDAAIAGRLARIPTVLHLHEECLPGLGSWLRGTAVRISSGAVSVSLAVADGLPSSVHARTSVIPNGVDTQVMSPLAQADQTVTRRIRDSFGIGPRDVMALAATRLDPCKRIEDLVTTILAIDDPNVHLVVAGSTSAYPDYEKSVIADAKRRVGPRITFCGKRSDMTDLLQASDVLIHAGMVEGMPLGVLEAQSCGVPVVAYGAAGVPEVVTHGETGFLADPGDVQQLSSMFAMVVGDVELRRRLGSAARCKAVAQHDIHLQALRNADLIMGLVGRRPVRVNT